MKNEAKLGIGVVILAALVGAVYVQHKNDAAVGSATSTSADLPTIASVDDLDKLEITNADKSSVELDKKGTGKDAQWAVAKPVAAPANQQNVKSLLDNLKDVKIKEVISTSAVSDDLKKDYYLDPTHYVHLVGYKAGAKTIDITFGKSGGRGEILETGDRPGVYAASGYSSYLYARDVKNWRETEILKFDDATIASMEIDNANGAFSFTKADHWAGTVGGKPIPAFDEDKVKNAVSAFKNLNADDFGDGKTAADTGLDAPLGTVTIQLKDNAAKYVLKVGKVSAGTSHYAQKDGDPMIYTIASWAADWATADASKFEKAPDGGVKDAGAMGAMTGKAPALPAGAMAPGAAVPPGHPAVPH